MAKTKHVSGEDYVIIDSEETPSYQTHTSGTSEPLYTGDDFQDAAKSLEMSEQDFNDLTMSDDDWSE